MLEITGSLYFLERGTKFKFYFIKKGSTESITQEIVVEMVDIAPKAIITVTAFRNKTMDMRIPLEISSKGMQNHDKTRSEVSGFIEIRKHSGNNTGNRMKQAVKKGAVIEKELTEILTKGENTVTMLNINKLAGHGSGSFHRILIAAGRTKPAVTAERNKLKLSAVRTAIHGTTVRRIAAMDHFVNVSHLSGSGMESIFDFFIIVCKDFL